MTPSKENPVLDQSNAPNIEWLPKITYWRPAFTLKPDPREVAEIFRLPLTRLLDPASLVRSERVVRGVLVPVYACQFGPHNIWGATAQILKSLREALNETR